MSVSPPDAASKDNPELLLIRPQPDGDPPGGAKILPRLSPSSPLLIIDPVPGSALPAPGDPIPILPSGALLSLQPLPPSATPPQGAAVIPPLSASRPMLVVNARGGPLPALAPDADPEAEAEAGRALHRRLNAAAVEALHQVGEPASPAVEAFQAGRVLWQGGDRLLTLVSAWRALRQPALSPETAARVLALLVLYITHTLGRALTLTASALHAVQQALAEMNQPLSQLLRLMSGVEARLNPPQAPVPIPAQAQPPRPADTARAAAGAGPDGERLPPAPAQGLLEGRKARPRRLLAGVGATASLALGLAALWAVAAFPRARTLDPAPLLDLLPVKRARLAEGTLEITLADESFAALPPEAQRALLRRLVDRLEQREKGAPKIHMGVLRSPGQAYFFQSGVGDALVLTPQP